MTENGKKTERPDILWAPWRIEYVAASEPVKGCIFCEKPRSSNDRKNLIVFRGDSCYVILNRFPYNNGHLMVVPFRHTDDFSSLSKKETYEMMELIKKCQTAVTDVMHPQGFNIGMNIGSAAGAGIADHLHFHLVPRWGGDTNFMPVTGQTKIISEALDATWEHLSSRLSED